VKVDYDKLSHTYDSHRGGGGPYLETLVHLATECRARRVLEIGSGTGNNSAALLNVFPCDLIGLELSRGMLARAVDKQIRARWIRGAGFGPAPASAGPVFLSSGR